MSNEIVVVPMNEIQVMAKAIAASNLFGVKTPDQALALMLVAQAEGRHPALAARDYDVIQGRPAKKSEAMLRDFIASGGKVEWHASTDDMADATFSHPSGGTLRITWDKARAATAGLGGKDNWKKYPRQMLRARTVSEGVRAVCPAATSGMYVSEEVQDFEPKPVTIEHEPKKEPEKPKKAEKDEMTDFAKSYATEIELADTSEKLEALVMRNAEKMGKLAASFPKWHEKLLVLLQQQRSSFDQPPVGDFPNGEVF